jgi:ethanolamine utilization protein EutP (predicted NTPase)
VGYINFCHISAMKKMLLMGYSGAGKTSMHSVIFANFPAKDTQKIGYTVERQ